MTSQMKKIGQFYELDVGEDLKQSRYFNDDLAPTKVKDRTWSRIHIAALWVGMSVCVPTYTLGGVLTAYFGLSIPEALVTILVANIVVLIPLILNACAGTKYGIPFPVILRSSFGMIGSNIPCLIRGFVACGWFGIQTMFGGLAIHIFLSHLSSSWAGLGNKGEVLGFFLFWLLNIGLVLKGGLNSIKWLETLSAPVLMLVGLGLLLWASDKISYRELFAIPANRPTNESVAKYFFSGLTAMIGFWATLSLNISDFSRYAKSQKDQIIGQVLGLPLTMFLFSALGVVLTAASEPLFGRTISDPITLIGQIQNSFWVSLTMILIMIATLSTNTAANIVSPTNDFQNIAPKYIDHKKGVLLTGLVGILMMSWELMKKMGWLESNVSVESFLSNFLLAYSSLLGPIAGIMIVDYFLIRKQSLNVVALYRIGSCPLINRTGFVAFFIPVLCTVIAETFSMMTWFYDYGWFTGSISGALIYYFLSKYKSDHMLNAELNKA